MSELVVKPKHSLVVKYILNKLIETENCNPLLDDGVSLLHLIIVVGHMYEKFDESINLIAKYVVNNPAKVNFTCPWTGMSTLDLALERKLGFCSRMLYTMGCRANKMIEVEKYLAVKDVKVKVPSGETGDPLEGMCNYNKVLDTWKNSEDSFIESMRLNIVGNENEGNVLEYDIIKTTSEWIQRKLRSMQDSLPFKAQVEMSGSIEEETKIRPLDEIDFVIKCQLDIDLKVSDGNSHSDWMCHTTLEQCPAQKELLKIDCKQPFQHLAKVILNDDYSELSCLYNVLTPERFSKYMDAYIVKSLNDDDLPDILKVPEGKIFLEQTKSGFFMNLEYESNGSKQELTLDLVTVLLLSKENYQKVLEVMPKHEMKKLKYLQDNKLLSCNDGIIVKNERWRMSFSNGEKKVIKLNMELYRALKYLNKCSEHHIDIPTYYLKEIFCSFIVHQGINNLPLVRPTLALSMAELIMYCETEPISSPFYCTNLGSQPEKNCSALFRRFKEEFPNEFECLPYLTVPYATPQCAVKLASVIDKAASMTNRSQLKNHKIY